MWNKIKVIALSNMHKLARDLYGNICTIVKWTPKGQVLVDKVIILKVNIFSDEIPYSGLIWHYTSLLICLSFSINHYEVLVVLVPQVVSLFMFSFRKGGKNGMMEY